MFNGSSLTTAGAVLSLRVLVVADVSAAFVQGGAERMLCHHLRGLVKAGFAVTVLTRQPDPAAPLRVGLAHDVLEHRLPFSGDKGYNGLKQLKKGAKAWWQKNQAKFDVVVAEQPFTMWALLAAGCDLPRLQVCHSLAFEEYATRHGLHMRLKHRLTIMAMQHLEKKLYHSASKIIILSAFMQARLFDLLGIAPKQCVVIPGTAEPLQGCSLEQREQYRAELGWQQPVVVTMRNLVPRTGVDLMIQAASIMKHSGVDVHFVIMGDGLLRQSMQQMACDLFVDDRVSFAGFVAEQAVQKWLIAADIFMLPTRGLEGFGLVTLEANICGTPVLATPITANKELVPTIIHNQLAASASPQALANKLSWMLDQPIDLAQRILLQQSVQQQYSWQHHDERFIAEVKQLR